MLETVGDGGGVNSPMVMAGFFGCRLFAIGALMLWAQVPINQVRPLSAPAATHL